MRNYNGQNGEMRNRMINGALLLLVAACLAYLTRGLYMPQLLKTLPGQKFSIASTDTITAINVIDRKNFANSRAVWRPRYIRAIAESLAKAEAADEALNDTEYEHAYTIYIHAYPAEAGDVEQLVIYTKEDASGRLAYYAAKPKARKLYAFADEDIKAIFSAADENRAEFLPNEAESQIALCSYRDGGALKTAVIHNTSEFSIAFDTLGEYFDRRHEETTWLMSVDIATDEAVFGQMYAAYFILRGESGQYYLADDEIMFAIDESAYTEAIGYLESLGPSLGYAMAAEGDVYSVSAYFYEERKSATITDLGGLSDITAIIRKVGLPATERAAAVDDPLMSISFRLNNNEDKPLENVGLLNYAIFKTEDGEYLIGSDISVYYPCFRVDEKDVETLIAIARRAAEED